MEAAAALTMPGTVLYSATVPLGEGVYTKASSAAVAKQGEQMAKANAGLVPYFVSGPLSQNAMWGVIGAALHVICFLTAVIFDAVVGGHLEPDTTKSTPADDETMRYWSYSFWTMLISLIVVVLSMVYHLWAPFPNGKAPPFLLTAVQGGVASSAVFGFLVLQVAPTSLAKHTSGNLTGDELVNWERTFSHLATLSLLLKVYVSYFLSSNIAWSDPATAYKTM